MTGGQTLEDFLTHCLFANPFDEVFDDLEVDVGLKECEAHFLQRFRDVLFGENPGTAQLLENLFEFFAERIEHSATKKKAIEALTPDLRSPRKF